MAESTASTTCTCGLLKVRKVGTRTIDGSEVCNNCSRPLELKPGPVPQRVPASMMTTLPAIPGRHVLNVLGVVTELTATSGFTATTKGNNALDNAMAALAVSAGRVGANAVVGLQASMFGAAGGITAAFGGDAVGVLLMGTAVTVTEPSPESPR